MVERNCTQISRDNPNLDCLIEVGTKAWVRADVWGDAAGTAPAVTSVRASAFDRFLRSRGPFKSTFKKYPGLLALFIAWLAVCPNAVNPSSVTINLYPQVAGGS